jgi:DNA-directed RNA polymerase specialized sigma24 family protein
MPERPEDRPPPSPAARGGAVPPAGHPRAAAGGQPHPPGTEPRPAPAIDSDEALLAGFAAGDAEAFAQLYDRHARATWRFIRHRLGPANEAAADVVLEASWIDAALRASRLIGRVRWTPWLYALVRRHALAQLAAPGAATDEAAPPEPARPAALAGDPKAQAQAFLAALARLPAPTREAVVLHCETRLDAADIAALAGEPVDEVMARLHGGLMRLAEIGVEHVEDAEPERVADSYAQAWALRDASSRGPSTHARDSALAAARAAVMQQRDEAKRAEVPPAPPAPPAPDAAGEQIDFAAMADAALDAALHEAARLEPGGKPVPGWSLPQPPTGEPWGPREPLLGADDPERAQAAGERGPLRPPPKKRASWTPRIAAGLGVALLAGVVGWQVRDKLGPTIAGAGLLLPAEPTAHGESVDQTRQRLDEALARAEAALGRVAAAPASAVQAAAPMPPSAAAPASAVALAAASEPLAAPAPAPTPASAALAAVAPPAEREAPRVAAAAATPASSSPASAAGQGEREAARVAAAAPASAARVSARARPATRPQAPEFDAAEAIAAAQARADAFLGKPHAAPARPAGEDARAARPASPSADAAVRAAQSRADAFLAGERASSPAR